MNWSRDKPPKPGWYWYRRDEAQSPVLMRVEGSGKKTTAVSPDGRWESVFNMAGEWSGPLEPPS